MPTKVDPEKCTGCEVCIDECPVEAIELKDDVAVVDEGTCSDCGQCVDICPSEAIAMD